MLIQPRSCWRAGQGILLPCPAPSMAAPTPAARVGSAGHPPHATATRSVLNAVGDDIAAPSLSGLRRSYAILSPTYCMTRDMWCTLFCCFFRESSSLDSPQLSVKQLQRHLLLIFFYFVCIPLSLISAVLQGACYGTC